MYIEALLLVNRYTKKIEAHITIKLINSFHSESKNLNQEHTSTIILTRIGTLTVTFEIGNSYNMSNIAGVANPSITITIT